MRIVDLLERDAALYGERTAVAIVDGPSLSYAELRRRVRRLALGLAARGVGRGDRIAIMAGNGLVYFDVYLAAAYLGAAAVPVNVHLTDPEVAFVLGDVEPSVTFVDERYRERVAAIVPPGSLVVVDGEEHRTLAATEPLAGTAHDDLLDQSTEDDVALIIYTSGTTGQPKGVCLTQRGLTFNGLTMAIVQRFVPTDVFLTSTPLYHAATGTRVTSMLVDGQTHVVMREFDVARCLRAIEEHGVTITVMVPVQLRRVLESPVRDEVDLSSLRLLVYGAAPTETPLIARAHRELACGLYQGYGLSEAVTNLTALLPEDHDWAMAGEEQLLASCGRPVPGVRLSLRDEHGAEVPAGEVGEVWVRTEKVMAGYWRRPGATAEAIVDGWLRTGDLGRLDRVGYLYLVGRAKDMLISGGVNVYPSEIEAVLHDHPSVGEAAVVGVPHPEWGEVPVAFLVPAVGVHVDVEDVRRFCADRLANLKVPRAFHVVADLPRTATGKVRKVDLRRMSGGGSHAGSGTAGDG